MIRNSSTGKFKAVMGIGAENKLCLTGYVRELPSS